MVSSSNFVCVALGFKGYNRKVWQQTQKIIPVCVCVWATCAQKRDHRSKQAHKQTKPINVNAFGWCTWKTVSWISCEFCNKTDRNNGESCFSSLSFLCSALSNFFLLVVLGRCERGREKINAKNGYDKHTHTKKWNNPSSPPYEYINQPERADETERKNTKVHDLDVITFTSSGYLRKSFIMAVAVVPTAILLIVLSVCVYEFVSSLKTHLCLSSRLTFISFVICPSRRSFLLHVSF